MGNDMADKLAVEARDRVKVPPHILSKTEGLATYVREAITMMAKMVIAQDQEEYIREAQDKQKDDVAHVGSATDVEERTKEPKNARTPQDKMV